MKHKQIIFLLTASLLLTGCDSSRIYEQSDILLVTSGYQYEGEYHNDFVAVQRMLSFGSNCTVLEPQAIREKIIEKLKNMRKNYNG